MVLQGSNSKSQTPPQTKVCSTSLNGKLNHNNNKNGGGGKDGEGSSNSKLMTSKPRPRLHPPTMDVPKLPTFSVALTKDEIEEDFLLMTGTKPPEKLTNKRPKAEQDQLNELFPGLYLNVKPDAYHVPDPPSQKR